MAIKAYVVIVNTDMESAGIIAVSRTLENVSSPPFCLMVSQHKRHVA
jgi:hypothetical protein